MLQLKLSPSLQILRKQLLIATLLKTTRNFIALFRTILVLSIPPESDLIRKYV
jgi:hypothetical protein